MEDSKTPFSNKCQILAELWMNYRDDEQFVDFIEYNDLGLPLAYGVANDLIESLDPTGVTLVEETFELLLAGLSLEDTGFEYLDDLLEDGFNRLEE